MVTKMTSVKKILLFILLSVIVMPLSAQMQRGLKGTYNTDRFPEVSFVWNTPKTEEISPSYFVLYEDERPVDSLKVEVLPIDESTPVNKSILILWEDMASHGRQSDFTREMLTRFFDEVAIAPTDEFNVAVFDRQKDTEKNVIRPLLNTFTSDGHSLAKAIASYQGNTRTYQAYPQQTDLYSAIIEGVEYLPVGRTGVIVVVTAGLNIKAAGASTDMGVVRRKALGAGIPIYVVKYPLAGDAPEINNLAEGTFGKIITKTPDISTATGDLKKFYGNLDSHLRGRDYKFTFKARCERDGRPHPLRIEVNKERTPQLRPPFIAPDRTFFQWLAKFWWLAILIVVFVAGVIFLLLLSMKKEKEGREQASQSMQEQFRRQQEESERRNQEAVEAMRREMEDEKQAARDATLREQAAAEEERLLKLMQAKNLFPRLQCKAGNEAFVYTVGKPRVTLGREADNDVSFTMTNEAFNNQTVSGHHAEIVFNGSAFEVVNVSRSYTQGIIVNGQFYQHYTLRSGDIIGLGEALISFYC